MSQTCVVLTHLPVFPSTTHLSSQITLKSVDGESPTEPMWSQSPGSDRVQTWQLTRPLAEPALARGVRARRVNERSAGVAAQRPGLRKERHGLALHLGSQRRAARVWKGGPDDTLSLGLAAAATPPPIHRTVSPQRGVMQPECQQC